MHSRCVSGRLRVWVGACYLLWALALPGLAASPPVVDLDASALPVGPLKEWPNAGSAGGAFTPVKDKPAVTAVAGRPAVQFSEKQSLQSPFNAPGGLTKANPWTLCVWAYPERLHGKQVFASWASRPYDCAEFGYGKSKEGAFCGWLRDSGFRRPPEPMKWHHFAFTYDGSTLRIYVDGHLDIANEFKLSIKSGEPVRVGSAWDAAKKEPCFGFRGAIARLRIWEGCLSHREVRNDMGAVEPFEPAPADQEVVEERSPALAWQSGHPQAAKVRVYLGEDRAAVRSGAEGCLRGKDLPAGPGGKLQPGELTLGRTYHWRVEQLDGEGKAVDAGPTWSFTVSACPAKAPQPRNRVAGIVRSTPELAWTPGRYAVKQAVYFGTSAEAVASGQALLARDLDASVTKVPLSAPLHYGQTYYWRVEHDNGPLPPAKGEVWAFRVEDEPAAGRLTFFVVSDTHYGLTWRAEPAVQALIDKMNFLPGTSLPPKAGGGVVRTPRGVIHLGDMTNDGRQNQWDAYVRDFGLRGEARLAFPIYEMFGNHDGGADLPIRKGIALRNRQRQGLAALSPSAMHCSWEWEGIRFINLGISVGTTTRPYDPQDSAGFLREELRRVTDRSQPIILMHHFGFDKRHSLRWWSPQWRDDYRKLIDGYNVLGLFHGHDHETEIYRWEGIDIFDAPHLRNADSPDKPVEHGFFVVQIENGQMVVAERKLDDTWGVTARKGVAPKK